MALAAGMAHATLGHGRFLTTDAPGAEARWCGKPEARSNAGLGKRPTASSRRRVLPTASAFSKMIAASIARSARALQQQPFRLCIERMGDRPSMSTSTTTKSTRGSSRRKSRTEDQTGPLLPHRWRRRHNLSVAMAARSLESNASLRSYIASTAGSEGSSAHPNSSSVRARQADVTSAGPQSSPRPTHVHREPLHRTTPSLAQRRMQLGLRSRWPSQAW